MGSSSGPLTGTEPTTGGSDTGSSSGGGGNSESLGQTTGGSTGVVTGSTGVVTSGGTSSGESSGGEASTTSGSTGGSSEGESSSGGESSGGVDLCADFKQPNCFKSGCDEGFECTQVPDDCVPSTCSCDPETGLPGVCTQDCGGGTCVPDGGVQCECLGDVDCLKVSSGCCLCNEGGDEVAAHKACVDQVMNCDLPPDQVFCPQVFLCTDAVPACKAGVCVLVQ